MVIFIHEYVPRVRPLVKLPCFANCIGKTSVQYNSDKGSIYLSCLELLIHNDMPVYLYLCLQLYLYLYLYLNLYLYLYLCIYRCIFICICRKMVAALVSVVVSSLLLLISSPLLLSSATILLLFFHFSIFGFISPWFPVFPNILILTGIHQIFLMAGEWVGLRGHLKLLISYFPHKYIEGIVQDVSIFCFHVFCPCSCILVDRGPYPVFCTHAGPYSWETLEL